MIKIFHDFNHLKNDLNPDFDILGIFELRILKSQSLKINISFQNYLIEQAHTESTAGGELLYINKKHSYKTHPDCMIYKAKKTWVNLYWSHPAQEN